MNASRTGTLLLQETHQHCRFARLLALHEAIVRHFHQIVRRFVHGERSDVARCAVLEKRRGFQLHFGLRLDEHLFCGASLGCVSALTPWRNHQEFPARSSAEEFRIPQSSV
jgi:hypothetical protein